MDISKFLGKVIGLYLIFVSIAMLANMELFLNYINILIRNEPLMFVLGFITLILGILLVVSHNIWQRNWTVMITIIAWLIMLKGASIILFPQFFDNASLIFVHNINVAYTIASFELIFGLLICYFGFKR
jgi:predicted transglutaminase-like protease